jgi:anti-sigma regulatory factor (Ser/Thr protein kinase)
MSLSKEKRDEIKQFILWNIGKHPNDIVRFVQTQYKLSRPTILRYIVELDGENKIKIEGASRDRKYTLEPSVQFRQKYPIQEKLAEDKVWRNDLAPLFTGVKQNVFDICHYGFTEIFNNAIDHSEGKTISVSVTIWINHILMCIDDDGVGIFNKIQKKFDLDDSLHAILELSKGKLTTDPESHTGEGIFFTSRMFDTFVIDSGKYSFATHEIDVMYESDRDVSGTEVYMDIFQNSDRTTESVFSSFASDSDDFGFNKTVVPVKLVRYGNENLVSRSQAKRLLTRLEKFKTVVLDFENIETIGRAFADEIFRVFVNSHPGITVIATNASKSIRQLIDEIHGEDVNKGISSDSLRK